MAGWVGWAHVQRPPGATPAQTERGSVIKLPSSGRFAQHGWGYTSLPLRTVDTPAPASRAASAVAARRKSKSNRTCKGGERQFGVCRGRGRVARRGGGRGGGSRDCTAMPSRSNHASVTLPRSNITALTSASGALFPTTLMLVCLRSMPATRAPVHENPCRCCTVFSMLIHGELSAP